MAGSGEQDPDLIAASQRLFAALTPDEVERLQNARPEEAELIIAGKLNYLLVHEPSLFVTIAKPGVPAIILCQPISTRPMPSLTMRPGTNRGMMTMAGMKRGTMKPGLMEATRDELPFTRSMD